MKIGIYNEPAGCGIGGSETMVAVLAEALAKNSQVDLLHHIPGLSAAQLAETTGTNMSGVSLCYVKPEGSLPRSGNPWQRHRASQRWDAALSESYDLFIAVMHGKPPVCHAAKGMLIVLFPAYWSFYIQPKDIILQVKSALRQPLKHFYWKWNWSRRVESYQLKTAISEFSGEWTRRVWGVDCEVLHPPVDNQFRRVDKSQVILSVGRFATEADGHMKKQREMIASFRELEEEGLRGWQYFCVGGLPDKPGHRAYFQELSELCDGHAVRLAANLKRAELKNLYERAPIFWHAAGYGDDESTHPTLMEHFGISTVEAMAAGCVPVVINKGGQREIIEHGVSGFLWDTLDELKEYTGALIGDEQMRARMSEAARARAQMFSREVVTGKFLELLRPLLACPDLKPAKE